jgi:predicted RNA-binding Zn-ribbon protein involved in translation (DUF1610 family)
MCDDSMMISFNPMPGKGDAMKILAREESEFRIACQNGHDFKAPRNSISVECPTCGKTCITRELVDRMVQGQQEAKAVTAA